MRQEYLMQEPPGFQPYSGFLNIYKEAGYTSMDVCARLRGILHMRKIGHAGTLDPMAEGVLPVALGRATRDVDRVGDGTKTYRAGMLLGTATDTQDITGTILRKVRFKEPTEEERAENGVDAAGACTAQPRRAEQLVPRPSDDAIREAVLSFLGPYEQLTPMYSARKVGGKKLYEYARAGKEVARPKKQVEILELSIEEIAFPHVIFTVRCTKGTYVRTLCHDIGERLGTGACMETLIRTRVGRFDISGAVKLSEVEAARDRGEVDSLLSVETKTALAIGKFDGDHIGHQKLFSELRKTAQAEKLRSCVLILNSGRKLLMPRAERRRALFSEGIDYVIELPFSEELRKMPAERFLKEILIGRYSMAALVAGTDVSFGYQKEGNAAFLEAHSAQYGYRLKLIEKLSLGTDEKNGGSGETDMNGESAHAAGARGAASEPVSSSLVRKALSEGDMELTEKLLGHPYRICGRVVHGRHLGTTVLGFPTMNVIADSMQALPPLGVYVTRTCFLDGPKEERGKIFYGISDLGKKPTVSDAPDYDPERVDLETNLFGYAGDAYGREISVEFLHFIRPERRFESVEAIRRQLLSEDVPKAKEFLAKKAPPCYD